MSTIICTFFLSNFAVTTRNKEKSRAFTEGTKAL